MKKVLLLLAHAIEEADMLSLLGGMGYDVFSIGAYSEPAKPSVNIRPALPDIPDHPELRDACIAKRKEHANDTVLSTAYGDRDPVDWAKADLPDEVIGWADVILVHHFEHTWLVPQWKRLKDSGKRIAWRTVGQSVEFNERMMAPLFADGLEIVRYSPKERNIPGYCGETTLIRFYKDPDEWCGWNGEQEQVINITQHLRQREPYTNWGFWHEATKGLSAQAVGPGSEEISGTGEVNYDQMRAALRSARCYLYTGTQPASYTLGLLEALMVGIPVVSIGPSHMQVFPYGPALFEGHELAPLWSNEPDEACQMLKELLSDQDYATDIGLRQRDFAIQEFGREAVATAWSAFLG